MNVTAKIIYELTRIREKVGTGDIDSINFQINLIERITTRFFENTAYCDDLLFPRQRLGVIKYFKKEYNNYTIATVKAEIYAIIDRMINELEKFGPPSFADPKFGQSATSEIAAQSKEPTNNILKDSVKDFLTGIQYNEIGRIAKEETNMETAIPLIIKKMKSFGADIPDNIAANLFVNSQLYGIL